MLGNLEIWQDKRGSVEQSDTSRSIDHPDASPPEMSGSEAQVEWALRIRRRVGEEFDRVEAAFRSMAAKQNGTRRHDTEAVIAILNEKRAAAMANLHAGYFIREWQEISDQVRLLIRQDARYQAIKARQGLESQI
jgi:hypothetical protein